MTRWLVWGALVVFVNIAGTVTSRARNTPSYWYHGIAAMANHAAWFCTTVIFVGVAVDINKLDSPGAAIGAFLFYSVCATVGSITAHYLAINYLERDNRRVGGYER